MVKKSQGIVPHMVSTLKLNDLLEYLIVSIPDLCPLSCFEHIVPGLFEEKRGDIVCVLQVVGTLCMQLILQFLLRSFETLQVCLVLGLKMCVLFGYNPQIIFYHFFHKMNLVIFTAKVNRY